MVKKTPSDINHVPWASANEKHVVQSDEDAISANVFEWACKNFDGTNKPKACSSYLLSIPIDS